MAEQSDDEGHDPRVDHELYLLVAPVREVAEGPHRVHQHTRVRVVDQQVQCRQQLQNRLNATPNNSRDGNTRDGSKKLCYFTQNFVILEMLHELKFNKEPKMLKVGSLNRVYTRKIYDSVRHYPKRSLNSSESLFLIFNKKNYKSKSGSTQINLNEANFRMIRKVKKSKELHAKQFCETNHQS